MYAKNELILLIGYSAWMFCYKNLPHRKKNPMLRRGHFANSFMTVTRMYMWCFPSRLLFIVKQEKYEQVFEHI